MYENPCYGHCDIVKFIIIVEEIDMGILFYIWQNNYSGISYAIFKLRKFESLFYKINTCLQKNY